VLHTAEQRLAQAREHLDDAKDIFVNWCAQGTKVVSAASARFKQDAEDVRLARDLITRNLDGAYLAHVFSSVLIGHFDALCARLAAARAPDLGSSWGRHSTKRVMEEYLQKELEDGLREAMRLSLEEVTAEMARQERPALLEIQRVARRGGQDVPWDAEVQELELALSTDGLQDFALQFFGGLGVGVITGLGAGAVELLLGELALGPVGLVAGVATFVALGVQTADWRMVREEFVKSVRSRQLQLVAKAKDQLNFPGLCERRRRRVLERMDVVLKGLLSEVAALSDVSSGFAHCALVLQRRRTTSACKSPASRA